MSYSAGYCAICNSPHWLEWLSSKLAKKKTKNRLVHLKQESKLIWWKKQQLWLWLSENVKYHNIFMEQCHAVFLSSGLSGPPPCMFYKVSMLWHIRFQWWSSSSAESWWRPIHLNQVCWSRETSKTCSTEGLGTSMWKQIIQMNCLRFGNESMSYFEKKKKKTSVIKEWSITQQNNPGPVFLWSSIFSSFVITWIKS